MLVHCAEFIEKRGMIDGIYRLSGVASNIQKLRVAFDEDRVPNLYDDRAVLQVILSIVAQGRVPWHFLLRSVYPALQLKLSTVRQFISLNQF